MKSNVTFFCSMVGWTASVAAPLALSFGLFGCGEAAVLFLNPTFVNQSQGGLFPFVPRPENDLLLVRAVNRTGRAVTFLVTVERRSGGTVNMAETTELFASPQEAADVGVLYACTEGDPITRVGLGENLNRPTTEAGLFISDAGAGDTAAGFGVPPNINPLSGDAGDFFCGDTVIFQVLDSPSSPGGFKVQAFVIPFETQPENTAFDTFQVAGEFLNGRPSEP